MKCGFKIMYLEPLNEKVQASSTDKADSQTNLLAQLLSTLPQNPLRLLQFHYPLLPALDLCNHTLVLVHMPFFLGWIPFAALELRDAGSSVLSWSGGSGGRELVHCCRFWLWCHFVRLFV